MVFDKHPLCTYIPEISVQDALLQKTFCEDFLTKKLKTNQGEVPQYYVENNHEAIIDPETFEMVQRELARQAKLRNRHSGVRLLSEYRQQTTALAHLINSSITLH